MIQVRMIREYVPRGKSVSKKFDKPFDPDILAENFRDLFEKKEQILNQIPLEQRFNVFYTLGHVPDESEDRKNRKWTRQEVIPFDIDGIDLDPNDDIPDVNPLYFKALEEALQVPIKKCTVVFSGNGLQVCIRLKKHIDSPEFFEAQLKYYQAICTRINDKLKEYNLKGEADPSAFAPNRLFRLPLTFNRKPGKPERVSRLLVEGLDPLDYSLKDASGLPDVADSDHLDDRAMSYLAVDTPSVLDGCDFLKHMKQNPDNVTEPEWYAGLSILGRLENGNELAHEYSKGHSSYYAPEVDRKLEQSLKASGPRTCDNINKHWGQCKTCPNYKKVTSPINIRGENFIATAHAGFHAVGSRGNLIPQYEDLRRYYEQETHYINVNDQHYRWMDTHYEPFQDIWIENYAQEHFSPTAKNVMASEFKNLVKRTNIHTHDFFQGNQRKINLQNGVYCIDAMSLEPHDPQLGFRYVLPFKYDPHAKAPNFTQHLHDITQGDAELQSILLEFMGYAISNDWPFAQKILILTGEGQNGKSTFLKILRSLAPQAGQSSLSARHVDNLFMKQTLDGSMFNIMEEVPNFTEKNFWEEMKDLSGGTSVQASKKFKDPYIFKCTTKFIMTCNELPKGANPSHGYYRRLMIVPFMARFSGKDDNKHIADKIISEELSGVFNMVLAGYYRLRSNEYKFTQSDKVDSMLQGHKLDSDNVARWAHENVRVCQSADEKLGKVSPDFIVAGPDGTPCLDVAVAYETYRKETENSGEKPVNLVHFVRRLKTFLSVPVNGRCPSNFEPIRVRVDGERRRLIRGITWESNENY